MSSNLGILPVCLQRYSVTFDISLFVCPEAASLEALDAWLGLRTVLAVETIRGVNGSGKVQRQRMKL